MSALSDSRSSRAAKGNCWSDQLSCFTPFMMMNRCTFTVDCVNEGSNRLDNIEIKADVPLNWTKSIEPASPVIAGDRRGR